MRRIGLALCSLLLLTAGGALALGTPDGLPPSIETVCDPLRGTNAFGLCNAYCEAMDCDSPAPHASPVACSRTLANFMKKTGGAPPCALSCPCTELLPIFAGFVNGTTQINSCNNDSNNILEQTGTAADNSSVAASVIRELGEAALPVCRVTNGQGVVTTLLINPDQVDPCIQVLINAAAAQNIDCPGGGA